MSFPKNTMDKTQKKMDLNKETAMRLWVKSFGKNTKANDFAGRVIDKGAYNDRNSNYGWNVDHILPQSKGGKTADYNLICCHITTNDEKADKFPCFTANKTKFEIVKVENHYEIRKTNASTKNNKNNKTSSNVNFFDSASGIRTFKKLESNQNKNKFIGTVLIKLQNISTTAVVDFIEKIFEAKNISYKVVNNLCKTENQILIKDYNMPLKEDFAQLLDDCILLNTYLKNYFKPMEYIDAYEIIYRCDCFKNNAEMYAELNNANNTNMAGQLNNALLINKLVYINTEAQEREPNLFNQGQMLFFKYSEYEKYDYTFTKLSKNLIKEVEGK